MSTVHDQRHVLAILATVAAAPLSFMAGVASVWSWRALVGPSGRSGEAVIADSYSALLIGGPVGLFVGSAVIAWGSMRLARRLTWPTASLALAAILAAGGWALHFMMTH